MEEKILEILDYVKKDNLKVGTSLAEIIEELFKEKEEFSNYLIKDIIKYSTNLYGNNETDIDYYKTLPAKQLIDIHRQLKSDYDKLNNGNEIGQVKIK